MIPHSFNIHHPSQAIPQTHTCQRQAYNNQITPSLIRRRNFQPTAAHSPSGHRATAHSPSGHCPITPSCNTQP
ncbi:unnamed protein product [Brassica rapa]|uniref:Uncharacterized protein n=1 Tax=Brassica campestris TaxID=3711 RepID=A0A8D9G131_BRACM|nr:unnamed protein product [Brassica rapa]